MRERAAVSLSEEARKANSFENTNNMKLVVDSLMQTRLHVGLMQKMNYTRDNVPPLSRTYTQTFPPSCSHTHAGSHANYPTRPCTY